MNQQKINRIVFLLSLLGLFVAIYVLQSFLRKSSIFCLNGNGCALVRNNPVSWPFGIPVPAFGLVGYIGLSLCSFFKTLYTNNTQHKLLTNIMLGISLFGICFVTWFTIMELFVIKGTCTWCAISTLNMYIIFGFIVYSVYNKGHLK
jgi:uncharacterized membrane protein